MISMLAALALAAATPQGDSASAPLADLQQVYDQSCASREYGAYDDMCDQLRKQIRQAAAEEARQARQKREPGARPAAKTASRDTSSGAEAPPH